MNKSAVDEINLNTPCFTVCDGQVVEGVLNNFSQYIEMATRPEGVGPRFYVKSLGDHWALVQWATWNGPEVIVENFDTQQEAEAAAERTYVDDILCNQEVLIFFDRAEAEAEAKAEQL